MIGKWLKMYKLKKKCHQLNLVYHEVHRMDDLTYIPYTYEFKHSAILLINGYGERLVKLYSNDHSVQIIKKSSPWYSIYGDAWGNNVSNVADNHGEKIENYNTFYIQRGVIFRKTIKPINGNAYVIDGEV